MTLTEIEWAAVRFVREVGKDFLDGYHNTVQGEARDRAIAIEQLWEDLTIAVAGHEPHAGFTPTGGDV